ncbi:MAG: phage/plasmid primase, P4 family, partial [Candidatus Poribacteria bacterium]|nr:phage/plasmid primase, P4 family [Candidatus Poribacteria bacterium]
DVHNPDNWLTYQQAIDNFNPEIHEITGFVLDDSGFVGLDLDHCLEINGDASSLKTWAKPTIEIIKGNYGEISPSDVGLKYWLNGNLPDWFKKDIKSAKGNKRIQVNGGEIEIYTHQYFTVTGNAIDQPDPSIDHQEQIDQLCQSLKPYLKSGEEKVATPIPPPVTTSSTIDLQERLDKARQAKNGSDFIDLFDKGNISRHDNDHSRSDFALCQNLAFWLGKDEALIDQAFRQSKLYREEKWDSRHRGDGATYGQMTIEGAISQTSDVYTAKTKTTTPRSAPTDFEIPRDYLMGSDRYYAELMVKHFGQDLRWCHDMEKWIVWNGKRWEIGKDHLVSDKMEQLAQILKEDIFRARDVFMDNSEFNEKDLKRIIDRAAKFSSTSRQKAVLEYCKRHLPIEARDLDLDVYLLNFDNCTVDLRTGEQRPHDREDYITKLIPRSYKPKAKAERWTKFVNQIMGGEVEMTDYLQRVAGYTCNGSTNEQVMFVFYGDGSNGKSTFAETCRQALGDYSQTVSDDFFMIKYQREHPTEIARLQGSRLVIGSESQGAHSNSTLDEGKVKRLTGGDTLIGRFMGKDYFEFPASQTYILLVNNKPVIRNTDDGIWRRLRLVPFDQKFEGDNRDLDLKQQLEIEMEGILAWMVEGAISAYQDGLQEPKTVTDASQEYRQEFDSIGSFIDECCLQDINQKAQSSRLYQAYQQWCLENGEYAHNNRQFTTELQRKGFSKRKSSYIFFCGLSLRRKVHPREEREEREDWEAVIQDPEKNKTLKRESELPPNPPNPPNLQQPANTPPPVLINQVGQDLVEDGQVTDPGNIIDFSQDDRHSEGVKVSLPLVGNVKAEDENSTSELQISDLQSHQLEIPVRMSEDTKHQLRELSPFEVEHLTSGKAVVNDLWEVYQADKEVGDEMSMRRSALYGCIITDSLDGT